MLATHLLRTHLRGLREQLGATGIGAFVSKEASAVEPLLIHEGEAAPPAEIATTQAAAAFLAQQPAGAAPVVARGVARDSWLIAFTGSWCRADDGSGSNDRRRRSDEAGPPADGCPSVVLSLTFDPDRAGADLDDGSGRLSPRWAWALTSAAALAAEVQRSREAGSDALTGLPGRSAVFAVLERMLRLGHGRRPVALLLVNPDDFASVNSRFGREAGDRTLREIADRLRSGCRGSDFLARYGSAIFALVLPDTPADAAHDASERTRGRLGENPFLEGALRLSFSAGVAAFSGQADGPGNAAEIVRRAHQALSGAKRAGGGTTALWDRDGDDQESRTLDRMSGIFTGNLAKDYRNISLLWDAVSAMAGAAEFATLAARFVELLMAALRPGQVALLDSSDSGDYRLVHGLVRLAGASEPQLADRSAGLGEAELALVETCRRERKAVRADLPARTPAEVRHGCCVPMISGGRFIGALYLDGPAEAFHPDASDAMFLEGLAAPLALARERAVLVEQQRRRVEDEKQRLEAELENLRRSLQAARLLHRSSEMDAVLSLVRRVAPTDATILITGESGTGKELLARTIHEMSPRRKGPFVVVDCGALPATLMESELFGHERGAFTGAESRRPGRLAEAEHGTVVLDEIGELPLELQSKLLRFVQERHVAPVGGKPRFVDARLVAATHRDLRGDVAAGRFRQDLFHRLNVVHLHLPPLRERPEDVLHLTEHYLERYALLYGRPARRLSPEAEAAALRYGWPGNVRELQNRIMQAVILGEGEEVQADELLGAAGPQPGALPSPPDQADDFEARIWAELRQALARSVAQAVELGPAAAPPLGQWLETDLVLAAHTAAAGVLRRGAVLTGLPEATFRRRQEQAALAIARGRTHPQAGPAWQAVQGALEQLVSAPPAPGVNRLDQLGEELLGLVQSNPGADVRLRCTILAVTAPTYRRRVAALGRTIDVR